MELALADATVDAYDALAPFYDRFTHSYGHEAWLANIEAVALSNGLSGNRLLDVGCGTGKSFRPMLDRGYDVTACDISPEMVARARARAAGTTTEVLVADARDLPLLGEFDLVISLDDALNYLLSEDELAAAFDGVARNLRPGGFFAFDLNTLRGYDVEWVRDVAMEVDEVFFWWRGVCEDASLEAGALLTAVIDVFAPGEEGCWRRCSSRHVQRHHPPELVERLLAEAGFELVDRKGHVKGVRLDPVGDETLHNKLDYFARRPATPEEGG